MRHLTSQEKKSTFATTMKGYDKYIAEALKTMQHGEELEMGAEYAYEKEQARRDIRSSLDDVMEFAKYIMQEAKKMQDLYK